jgi:hypothetical protein
MEPAEVKLKEKGIKGTKQVKEIEGIKAEGNKTEDLDEQESEEEDHVVGSQQTLLRKQAIQRKANRQEVQGKKMQRYRQSTQPVFVGAIVTIKTDYRDISHPRGIPGIVFDVSKSGAGGVQVATEHGVIVSGETKRVYYIPSD